VEIGLESMEVKTICDLEEIFGKIKKYGKVFNIAKFFGKYLIVSFTSGF
jgi:hypothetical protein